MPTPDTPPMIAYLWVAVGSAIGGMARYGFGLLALRLWGSSFPWGTITINIVGSFVIGFFGTLTLADGLLPANANLRIFVMIGICGGFTTFSSFSLQTLDLARGGAWLGAAGNIALSVLACLLAVTAGHAGADRLNGFRTQASYASARILAVLDRPETARAVLATASLAARHAGGTVEILHIRHDPDGDFLPTEDIITQQQRQEIESGNASRSAQLHALFDQFQTGATKMLWREVTGSPRHLLPAEAAQADFLVLARPHPHSAGNAAREALHAALFDVKAATLLVPGTVPATLGRHIAIAWKSASASDRAVQAALPFLTAAERITILTENEESAEPTSPALERLAKPATRHSFSAASRPIGQALLQEAKTLGADLLVMGAYSRSEVSEFVLDGATREILAGAEIPVLLRH